MERPSDEDWDSWLIESIRRYTDLHMFDLQQPCRVLVWTERQSLCLAGCHTAQHNDILELQLPSKLLQLSSQEMCPERDFKVIRGGLSERPIHCLKYIPEHRLLVSSGPPDNSLQVWKIGVEDTDLIKMQQRISNENHDNHWSRADVSSSNATNVLHGSCSKNITVSDIGTGQASYRAGSKYGNTTLADLTFLDRHSFLTCTSNGHLYRLDTRVPPESLEPADLSTTDLKDAVRGVAVSATQVARLSASGTFHLFDLRELQSPVGTADVMPSTPALESDLCVAWAPHLPGYIAMSGFESIVQIYDTSTWNSIPRQALPVFTHEGHAPGKTRPQHPRVSALAWHPLKARTVFSADEYGTLQAWNWVPD